jgi:tRNA nucleotidyltransferase/poly(A) polymerase
MALIDFLASVARKVGVADHVYVVGGAVRNSLLGLPIKDVDLAIDTIGTRGYSSEHFAGEVRRSIPATVTMTTNNYGVSILTVKGPWMLGPFDMTGEVIEIANARSESYGGTGGKGYKPSEVRRTTIEEDVYRREFTVNTLMWRLSDIGNVIDLTGRGVADLNAEILRTPRDPDRVFADDPTRMLRAVKFVVKYGFVVEDKTRASIRRNAMMLANVPWEAVASLLAHEILVPGQACHALEVIGRLGLQEPVRALLLANKGFVSYLSDVFKNLGAFEAAYALDVFGWPLRIPLGTLSPEQRRALADYNDPVLESAVIKPRVDNDALIRQFNIPPSERGNIATLARAVLLEHPHIAHEGPQALTLAVARYLRAT